MTTIQTIKTQLSVTRSIVSQYGLEKEVEKIDKLIAYGENKQLTLLVCGEFKRGKSSFINAFLGEDVCPVAEGITTSVISIIKYGKNRKVVRHYGNVVNQQVESCKEEISFEEIASFANGTVSDIDNTIMLEIEIPSERLKDGLTIIDTPGVGSLDPRHLFLTLYALPKADVIFFITDAGEPLTSTELNFYQKYIFTTKKPSRVLVNKCDTKLRRECNQIVEDTQNKLQERCNNNGVQVISVSSKLWLEYNAEPDNEEKKQMSHLDDILAAIDNVGKEYGEYLLEYVRSQYIDLLQQLINLVITKKEEISQNSENAHRKDTYQEQLTELKKMRDDVINEHSELRKKITKILDTSCEQVSNKLQHESVLLSTEKLEELIGKYSHESDGGNLVAKDINESIRSLSRDIDMQIDQSFNDVMAHVQQQFPLEQFVYEATISGDLKAKNLTMGEKVCAAVQKSLPALTIGGLAGAIIWWPVGIAAGIAYIVTMLKRDKALERAAEIKRQLTPRISIAINELNTYIKKRYKAFNEVLIQSLTDTAQQMMIQMQDVIELMKECDENEQRKKAKIKELDTQIKFLQTQLIQARIVNTNPFA